MPETTIKDGRILLTRSADEKRPLLLRLTRIEGQVRGLRNMIEEDRYCLDEIQQINAATAALREVALAIIGQHLAAGVRLAADDGAEGLATEDVMRVLKAAMRKDG